MYFKVKKSARGKIDVVLKLAEQLLKVAKKRMAAGDESVQTQSDFNDYSILIEMLTDLKLKQLKEDDYQFLVENLKGKHAAFDDIICQIEPRNYSAKQDGYLPSFQLRKKKSSSLKNGSQQNQLNNRDKININI